MAAAQTLGGLTGYRRGGLDEANCYNVTFASEVRRWVGFRPMAWLRSNRRPWVWVALLALTLQLGLAFGHVHGLHAVQPALTATADAGNAAPSHPSGGDQDDNDYCTTCAILALLTGAQTASAPVVALPAEPTTTRLVFRVDAACIDSRCSAFRSRAPPIS